jgi:hypothetical protein
MNNYQLNEKPIIPLLRKTELTSAIEQYSDYVIDLGGMSFETFLRREYLKDKHIDDVLIKSEVIENPQTIEDIISDYMGDYFNKEDVDDPELKLVENGTVSNEAFDYMINAVSGMLKKHIQEYN